MAPTPNEIIDWNIRYEYSYVLIVGSLSEIRAYVYDHAEKPALPDYRFQSDRRGWHYINARDAGWPIRGELNVLLDQVDPQMYSPPAFWAAGEAPVLYIRAAYHSRLARGQVFWKNFGDQKYTEEKSAWFDVINDDRYHTYKIDLSSTGQYRGSITGLRFDPVGAGVEGEWVKVSFISFNEPPPASKP